MEIKITKDKGTLKFEFKKQEARAADPNMMLFWAGDCAAPPSGWSVVSDGVSEPFYQIFPRGAASYTANNGSMGAATHTHTGSGTSSAATATDRKTAAGSTHNSTTHTHPVTVGGVDSISSLPAYKNLCVIKYSGIPTGASAIPQNAIAIFDTTSLPSGWSDYSSTFSTNYIRGNGTAGGTGGSNSHAGTGHTVSSISLTGVAGTIAKSGTTATRSSLANHTHTVSNQTSNTPATEPPYITIVLGQKTSSAGVIPGDMIAMFDGSSFDSNGWQLLSGSGGPFNNVFLKVTGAYGTTGGAAQHTHAQINATSDASSSDTGGSGTGTIPGHQHPVAITLADGTNTNLPPYTDVVIAKRAYVFTSLTTDKASYPTVGETITADAQVDNHSNTNLTGTYIDYVVFIDSNADNQPTSGETYVTSSCAGSGSWSSGNYTWQKTGLAVNANSNATDQQSCANTNFPSNTTYTLWAKWWDGASLTYDVKYVTFSSVPTLGFYLLILLVIIAVYITYKTGYLKLRRPALQTKTSSLALKKNVFEVRDFGFGKEKVINLKKAIKKK